jgi:phosphatidylserine/phosphatidylglycerophosphate/cardiolipin synthase-like enzyme
MAGLALVAAGCSTSPTQGKSTPKINDTTTITGRGSTGTTSTPVGRPAGSTTVTPNPTTTAPSRLSLWVEPQIGMTPLYDFMSSARLSLDMTMYELSDAAAEQILITDHQRGVRVRVLLDHAYSGGSVNQAAFSTLSSAGVPVAWANDSEIFHQKTITVDGDESAIMTGNFTSQYYATTRDFVVMDDQASDVAAIESVFTRDWSGAIPSPGSPAIDLVWSPGSESQLAALIDSATRSVVVENEEMDSTSIEDALESDAKRGIDATVVMTADGDWDSTFSQLESDGVHVVLYPHTASALYIHAKVIDVDDSKAFLGSENFSAASLDYNRELGLITSSVSVLGPLNSTLSSDISNGELQQPAPPPATPPTSPALPTNPTASGCYPIDDEGRCYEPGEYCRDDDHGSTGRSGNGQTITCEVENGTWYWEST